VTALTRTVVVAEMQARDLLRRRAVMALFVLLPAAFYYSVPAGEPWSVLAASMGVSWAVAAAGVFGILGWRRADPRLALAGAPAVQGLLGRLLLLQALAFGLVALFVPQVLWRSSALLAEPGLVILAFVLLAVVSVPLGMAIGALVPREMEGTLVLIGVLGVGMSVPPDTPVARVLPTWGPVEIIQAATGIADVPTAAPVAHALVSTVLLLALVSWSWRRRVRIVRRPEESS
jgi:hypothetical protein